MSEMVERVAKAILDDMSQRKGIGDELDQVDDEIMEEIKEAIGRAAISAMRQPNRAMSHAGFDQVGQKYSDVWKAMIDEALK